MWLNLVVFTDCHPHLSDLWQQTSMSEKQHIVTYSSARSVWFPYCYVCILYAASVQYLAPGKRGVQQWVSASPHALHMSQGKLCTLYICTSCVFADQTSLFFRYYLLTVAWVFLFPTQKTNECIRESTWLYSYCYTTSIKCISYSITLMSMMNPEVNSRSKRFKKKIQAHFLLGYNYCFNFISLSIYQCQTGCTHVEILPIN